MQIVQPIQWKNQYLNKNICLAEENIYIKMNQKKKKKKKDQPESEDTL